MVARLAVPAISVGVLGLVSCGQTRAQVGAMDFPGGDQGGETSAVGGAGATAGTAATGGGLSRNTSGAPIYTRATRLTNSQFEHAAIAILGLPEGTDLKSGLVGNVAGLEFSNNEHGLTVSSTAAFNGFEEAAEKAAALATSSAAALARVHAGEDVEGFVRALGRRAFRRPLEQDEVTRYTAMFARGEELYGAGFANGAALVIRAMLQSPSFLYRTELGPAGEPLSGYEIASKLSFWLLDTTPSDALLDAAAKGELDTRDGLLSAARAMLEDGAAQAVMRTFHRELYRLDRFDQLFKPAPEFSPALGAEAKEASTAFFDRVFSRDEGVRDILVSPRGFVGPHLAPLYGQIAPSELEERELGSGRLGYFMQVPPLMLNGHGVQPATVARGLDVLLRVLCLQVPSPLPSEIPPLPELEPNQTNRERLIAFTDGCGGECHRYIDPLGFAFEGFDGMGVARELDEGRPVDASGTFSFSSGEDSFDGAAELMQKLAADDMPYDCYAQKLASYGLQRDIVAADVELVGELAATGREGSVKDLVLALVGNSAFRLRHQDLP